MKWSAGVTTVPSRRLTYLPRTLNSLAMGGFGRPHLFIDGGDPEDLQPYDGDGTTFTSRFPCIRCAGHWILSALELYLRDPWADRYALFQDDLLCVRNLRQYLEAIPYPDRGYLNLLTNGINEPPIRDSYHTPPGTVRDCRVGWHLTNFINEKVSLRPDWVPEPATVFGMSSPYPSWQGGRGAVALVFSNEALRVLLSNPHLLERAKDPIRGWQKIDGGIVEAMNQRGWEEYCHVPSLVQHLGHVTSNYLHGDSGGYVNIGKGSHTQPDANTFPRGEYDAMKLLNLKTLEEVR